MDYDSSSKFISSLAKFLQSLCNGYVEFDNGVEVIGHIYLSVDTGKKIDYILNEKVCKTDENSVTFISNSFHAQPAEKPKPSSKKGKCDQSDSVESVEISAEGSNEVEPRSTNMGTIPRNSNRNLQSSSPGLKKRPFSPHSKSGPSISKKGRSEFSQDPSGFGAVSEDGNLSPLRGQSHLSSSDPPPPNSSQSFDPGYHPGMDNSNNSEERDIKPSMDTDVTFVKEEFGTAQAEGDRSQDVDGSFSMFSTSQSYSEGSSSQSFNQQNSRLGYGGERSDSGMYNTNLLSSQLEGSEGGTGADPSVTQDTPGKWPGHRNDSSFRPLQLPKLQLNNYSRPCKKCDLSFRNTLELNAHKKECTGKRHLTCGVCSKVLSRYDALAEHLRGMHGIGTKVACRFCGKGFKYKPQVYQHQVICPQRPLASPEDIKIALNIEPGSFLGCDLGVGQLGNFSQDMQSIVGLGRRLSAHSGGGSLACPICQVRINRKDNLRVHMRNKHNIGEKAQCKACGLVLRSFVQLERHRHVCKKVIQS